MHGSNTIRTLTVALALLSCATFAQVTKPNMTSDQNVQSGAASQWKAVETAMGRPGKLQPDGTYKFSMPRKDLKVTLDGTTIKPALALSSWAAFEGTQDHAMAMGYLVLTEAEVEPS